MVDNATGGSSAAARPPRVPLRAADYTCSATATKRSTTAVEAPPTADSCAPNSAPATLREILRSTAPSSAARLPSWTEFFDTHDLIHLPTTTGLYTTAATNSGDDCDDVPTNTATDVFSVYRTAVAGAYGSPTCDVAKQDVWFVFLHGAGHSALSWALVARLLKNKGYRSLAYDARGHGKTKCLKNSALSADNLVSDGVRVLTECFIDTVDSNSADGAAATQVVLVGHSMGGAIASKVAASPRLPPGLVVGLVVLDAVEGTAMAALPGMRNFVKRFPPSFPKEGAAVDWSVQVGILSNVESARISIPSQIYETPNGKWKWILDLGATEEYWVGWFKGLSESFVNLRLPKVLMLAGEERLDKPLMIAQMQGRFQLTILTKSGHVLEEDQPNETCEVLVNLAKRIALSSRGGFAARPPPTTAAAAAAGGGAVADGGAVAGGAAAADGEADGAALTDVASNTITTAQQRAAANNAPAPT